MLKKTAYVLMAVIFIAMMFVGCSQKPKADDENIKNSSKKEVTKTSSSKTTPEKDAATEPYPGELTSILLMGSMQGDFSDDNNQNYALTHILVTIDPETRSLRFTSFPYNLQIEPMLDEETDPVQLQFLYADYGPEVTVNTLSARFGIDIDGWVIMNMHAVKSIVDELGGLEIDISDLSVNEMSDTVEALFGYVWNKIDEKGVQPLDGIQTIGYFLDTYRRLDELNPVKDEEERFRKKRKAIIDAVIAALNVADTDSAGLLEIARNARESFATDIKENRWNEIAKMALACIENSPQYFYVPQDIVVKDDGHSIEYDKVSDVNAVIEFVKGE